MVAREHLVNLSAGKAALQSSFSAYSTPDDPLGPLDGRKTGGFTFHTDYEQNPWWILDIGEIAHVKTIMVYNRCDAARDRARCLSVDMYEPATGVWQTVYKAINEFGGKSDNDPLKLDFGSRPRPARFIKLEIDGPNCLHLDQVEVFGYRIKDAYISNICALSTSSVIERLPKRDGTAPEPYASLGAIVALVRGYGDIRYYEPLIARNKAIYDTINAKVDIQYPLILWHEGNIGEDQQNYIRSRGLNTDVRFVDVSREFQFPPYVDRAALLEHWHAGYRLMCKINTWDIWNLTKDFKYILRVDEDCVLEKVVGDPFKWIDAQDLDCAFSLLINDGHDLTHESLPCFVEAYTELVGEPDSPNGLPLTSRFPYTNVMMAKGSFFRLPHVSNFLRQSVLEPDFYINRWGDHIVLGVALNLFSSESKIGPIEGLCYHHASHGAKIVTNDDMRDQDRLFFKKLDGDESHAIQNDLVLKERALLRKFKACPLRSDVRDDIIKIAHDLKRHRLVGRLIRPRDRQAAYARLLPPV
jgi:hypothetical protein